MKIHKRQNLEQLESFIHALPKHYKGKFYFTDWTMKEINELRRERDMHLTNCEKESIASMDVTDNVSIVFRIQS